MMKYFQLLSIPLIMLLTACGPSPEEQATMTATAITATAAAWTATPSMTMTATITATPTRIPTKTSTPTNTPDLNRYFAPDNSFSLVPPAGWQVVDEGGIYPVIVGPKIGNLDARLSFHQEENPFMLAMYTAFFQDALVPRLDNYSLLGELFCTTNGGKDCFIWEFSNTYSGVGTHQTLYFYESGSWKLVITYLRPINQGSEYDTEVAEAMMTLIFDR